MAHIEEDGQSCIQEVNDNWGSDVVAVEKCLYTHKWADGRTVTIPQLLDNDLNLINADLSLHKNIERNENNIYLL